MTEQEAFDAVATHLLTQMQMSVSPERGDCRYRGDAGKKCAIGALVPDDKYDYRFEGSDIRTLLTPNSRKYEPALARLFDGVRIQLLEALQNIHDRVYVRNWHVALFETARVFDLNTSALEAIQ